MWLVVSGLFRSPLFPLPSTLHPPPSTLHPLSPSPSSPCTLSVATDRVQQCKSAMQGDLEASQEGQVTGDSHLNPSRLNLLYCCSLSCPLLTEDTESGTNPCTCICIVYIHVRTRNILTTRLTRQYNTMQYNSHKTKKNELSQVGFELF